MKKAVKEREGAKAVIYARYSSHSQTDQSIEGQLRDNYAWAKQQGITVIGEYIDRALTGTKDRRPDFQRMIEDAAKCQFDLVIVWKLDRFARNRYDSAMYKAKLKKYGVRVVSVMENISDTPEGIILEGLLESMAEYYSANLSQNIRRGQRENMEKGLYCGGTVPYGYKLVNKKLIANPKDVPNVRYLFEQYAAGVTKKEIIEELNRRGVRNRRGNPLSATSFQRVLNNPAYTGNFTYNGEVIPGLSDRIIDDATFERVQVRLAAMARVPTSSRAKTEYLLRGKAFCGHCGSPMVGESGVSRNGSVYNYYTCAEHKRTHSCAKKNERKDFIEWYVVEQTLQYVLTPERASRIAKGVVKEYEKEFSGSRVREVERAIQQIDCEVERLIDILIETPKASRGKIHARMESLELQKAELETDLAHLRAACGIKFTEIEVLSWLKKFCNGDPLDEDFRRRIIDVFINSVYLYDNRIIVFYNIRGGKQVSYVDVINSDEIPEDIETGAPVYGGSDGKLSAPPNSLLSEPKYVFVTGIFGCIFQRMQDDR